MKYALWLLLVPGVAEAHEVGKSFGVYTAEASGLAIEVTFAERELAFLADGVDEDGDGKTSAREVATATVALTRDVLQAIEVRVGSTACTWSYAGARQVEADGVSVRGRAVCPAGAATYAVSLGFLDRATPGHRHFAQVMSEGSPAVEIITHKADRTFNVGGRIAPAAIALPSALLGYVELFVFALVALLAGGTTSALRNTSLALVAGCAAAIIVPANPDPRAIDALIALSLVYVAIENAFVADVGKRPAIAFGFGLIRGMSLRALGAPSVTLAGVAAVAALIAIPVVLVLQRKPWFRPQGVRVGSGLLAILGLAVLAARRFG